MYIFKKIVVVTLTHMKDFQYFVIIFEKHILLYFFTKRAFTFSLKKNHIKNHSESISK